MRPLTDRDWETLGELIGAYDSKYGGNRGQRPLDFGGSNGSHHSATATKLVGRGLAEHTKGREWGKASTRFRGSKLYRPTDTGRLEHAKWQAYKDGSIFSALRWLVIAIPDANHPLIEQAKALLDESPMTKEALAIRRSKVHQIAADIVDSGSVPLDFEPMAKLEEAVSAI